MPDLNSLYRFNLLSNARSPRKKALTLLLCFAVLAGMIAGLNSTKAQQKEGEKIGVFFTALLAWGAVSWPKSLNFTLDGIERDLLDQLKKKSSSSDRKLEVVRVTNADEAARQGIKLVYAIDYREKPGEHKTTDIAVGQSTDIFCVFKRADQNTSFITNWDDLKIAKFGKDLDLRVEKQPGFNVSFTAYNYLGEYALRQAIFRINFVLDDAAAIPKLRIVACPTVRDITPTSGTVGAPLTITGTNFSNLAAINFSNGSAAKFTINNDEMVSVATPTGAASGAITLKKDSCPDMVTGAFTVLDSPMPSISGMKPASAKAGSPDLMITINGSNFTNASVVKWNGSDRITTFVDSTQLKIQAPAADLAEAGKVTVVVFNPAPGGGASNEMSFTVNRKQPQAQTHGPGRKPTQRPGQRSTKKP